MTKRAAAHGVCLLDWPTAHGVCLILIARRQPVGILGTLRDFYFGSVGANTNIDRALRSPKEAHSPRRAIRNSRRCQIEELEPRRLFAADVAPPHVLLGSTYFESDTGDDILPDVLQVSFTGGATGTTLNKLTIITDKRQD